MMKIKLPDKSIAEQAIAMKVHYPHFVTKFLYKSLRVEGCLQPTSRSVTYNFILKYNLKNPPRINIVSPVLTKNDVGDKIPHLYSSGNLCLYQPKYKEFKRTDYLFNTIIPWTSLWLYYYEIWHLTGLWQGGGEHP